jgi:hypothetical protein
MCGQEGSSVKRISKICQSQMVKREGWNTTHVNLSVLVSGNQCQVFAFSEFLETLNVDVIVTLELVIVGGINESEGEHALLLQVGLVDTGKAADDDGQTTEVSGLKSSMFTAGTLTIVRVTNDDPLDATVPIVSSGSRDGSPFASLEVKNLVGLVVHFVNGTDQAVLGDVLEMSTVLEPWATSRDVIRCAFTLDLDENRQILGVFAVPWLEWLEELEAVRLGVNGDIDGGAVFRWWLERVLSRVVATWGEFITRGIREFEFLAVRALESVRHRVEGQITCKGHSSYDIRGSDECMGGWVGIVTTSEVPVVACDNRVDLALLDVATIPLSNAGSASVGKNQTANLLKGTNLSVTLDGSTDLLGTRGDGELGLDGQTMSRGFVGNGCRAGHVFIRRVGARTDQGDFELGGPVVLLDGILELGEGSGQIGGERTVDVGLEFGQVL